MLCLNFSIHVFSECGHGKCFECMFNSSERCNICLGVENAISPIHAGSGPGGNRIFASVHGRVRAPASGRTRPGPVALKTASAFSRESGFQSATASLCSGNGADGFPPSSAGEKFKLINVYIMHFIRRWQCWIMKIYCLWLCREHCRF